LGQPRLAETRLAEYSFGRKPSGRKLILPKAHLTEKWPKIKKMD
jgi:hypothetical protein